MSIIVQKYGGSSVADEGRLRHVAQRIVDRAREGHQLVVVVSAMGKTTNALLASARRLNTDPPPRELDMLLSTGERISMSLLSLAVNALGMDCISLTGPQSGICTTGEHFGAKIDRVEPARVRAELAHGRIVIVAGYQGRDPHGEVTTLGRGGSDTTAVALAAALEADRCEICSDVDGIYSADPRVVDGAVRLQELSYEEMLTLAHHGARVLNSRAVEYARKRGVTIHALSTFSDRGGTVVRARQGEPSGDVVGVACHSALLRLSLSVDDSRDAGLQQELRCACGEQNVFLEAERGQSHDMLVSAATVPDPDALVRRVQREFRARVKVARDLGSVSAVGLGLGHSERLPGDAAAALHPHTARLHHRYATPHAQTWLVDAPVVHPLMRGLHACLVQPHTSPRQEVA